MKTNHYRKTLLIFVSLICLVIPLRSDSAAEGVTLLSFSGFIDSVVDGHAKEVRGVYEPQMLALRVMEQPGG